jgi:hypothetical protein
VLLTTCSLTQEAGAEAIVELLARRRRSSIESSIVSVRNSRDSNHSYWEMSACLSVSLLTERKHMGCQKAEVPRWLPTVVLVDADVR